MMPNLPIGCLFNSPTRFSEPKWKKEVHPTSERGMVPPQGSASSCITFEPHVFVFYSFIFLLKLSNRKYNDRVRGAWFPPWGVLPTAPLWSAVANKPINPLSLRRPQYHCLSQCLIRSLFICMIWMLLRMDWYGGWELPTQVSSMLSRRSAMATMTRTWFNHFIFMMKMKVLLITSYFNTIDMPRKDRDNAPLASSANPKIACTIRILVTLMVTFTSFRDSLAVWKYAPMVVLKQVKVKSKSEM